jgi:hypothetical protein
MTQNAENTVVGVFTNREQARQATNALKEAGFNDAQIGVSATNTEAADALEEPGAVGTGTIAGAATGAGVGALWGLGILAGVLPAIGPAIAGGTLAVLLSSAAAGAATVGLAGALLGMGLSKDEADYYEGEWKAGRTIVTVVAGGRRAEALAILRQFDGYDMTKHAQSDVRAV